MILEKIKSDIVAHLSYYIGFNTEAAIIDPQRDCEEYIELAKRHGMTIKYIFETHRNEDYIIGSEELAEATGAEIIHGSWPDFHYGKVAEDGEVFDLDELSIKSLYTPGHTPGCTSYAVIDKTTDDDPLLVFTGDALFVNEVGRTDLGGEEKKREWSANLYDSIHNKILPLGDNVILCPAHGSGSVCGSNLAEREISTIGTERKYNPRLQLGRDEFIEYKVNEYHGRPPYFRKMEKLNKEGSPPLGHGPNPVALKPSAFKAMMNDSIVLDVRSPTCFASGHIKDSLNLFSPTLGKIGWVLSYDKPIFLVFDEQCDLDTVSKGLARIGYDNQVGYLSGSMVQWYKSGYKLAILDTMTTFDLKEAIDNGEEVHVLDVRTIEEYKSGNIKDSQHIYMGYINEKTSQVPENKHVAVICSSGVRSSLAASILLRHGFDNISLVLGGTTAWSKSGFPLT